MTATSGLVAALNSLGTNKPTRSEFAVFDQVLKIKALYSLGLIWAIVIVCVLVARFSGSRGKRDLLVLCAYLLGTSATFSTMIVAIVAFFPPNYPSFDENFWVLILGVPVLCLVWILFRLLSGIGVSTVPLKMIEIPRSGGTIPNGQELKLRIGHLSDLHISDGPPLEGCLDERRVVEATKMAISWALERSDLVVLTGDLTDKGAQDEWLSLLSVLDCLSEDRRSRILFIPGNHDLSLTTGWEPFSGWSSSDSSLDLGHEERCRSFVLNALKSCPCSWFACYDSGEAQVRNLLKEAEEFIREYEKYPPKRTYKVVGSEMVPWVEFPPELFQSAQKHQRVTWPTPDRFLFKDLLDLAYPMLLYEDHEYCVFGLNSSTTPADTLLSSGFGAIGKSQLRRLRMAINRRIRKRVILLVHHHVGCPPKVMKSLKEVHTRVQIKALQLLDAGSFDDFLRQASPEIVFHGHMHVGYHAKRRGTIIISAPSVAYGDSVKRGSNCYVYGIDQFGGVCVVDECKVIAANS